MVPGEYLLNFVFLYFLYRPIEQLRVSGRVKCVKASLIYQIARIQIVSLQLIKAAVSRGMPRRVNDLDFPTA